MTEERVHHHSQLRVWQTGMDLVVAAYQLTRGLPREERFGLTSRLRRAAVSVPSNVAEGHARIHRGDFLRHLSVARGSIAEVETLLEICERLEYASPASLADTREHADHSGRMLTSMIRRMQTGGKDEPGT